MDTRNIPKLEESLRNLGIPKWSYSFKVNGFDDGLYYIWQNERYLVYYQERGGKTNLATFLIETDATEYFLNFLVKHNL
jgi:hypothetical protein